MCGVVPGIRAQPITPDLIVARIAGRQHGVISTAQLRRAGLSASAIDRRVRAARLFRVHRGVYAVGHPELTDRGRWKAATLALGGRAVLSHRSAAELWEMLRARGGLPHVSVPYPAAPAKRTDIRIHRSRSLAAARTTSRHGIPVTMPGAPSPTSPEPRRQKTCAGRRGPPRNAACRSGPTTCPIALRATSSATSWRSAARTACRSPSATCASAAIASTSSGVNPAGVADAVLGLLEVYAA